tara:strand:- start:646 stop:1629 length:984 start_codon:yes stop_codon:yes gene_type:complete
MQPSSLNEHSSMGSFTFPQQSISEASGNNITWYSNPMDMPTISTSSPTAFLTDSPNGYQAVSVNMMTSPFTGDLNYTEIRNTMDQEIAKQESNQSNNFIVNHLKIHEYIKSLNETIEKWDLGHIDSEISECHCEAPAEDSDTPATCDPDVSVENVNDLTKLVINNIDKIDFNQVGCHMKNTLKAHQYEIDTLIQKFKTQSTLLESLDTYNNKIIMDLMSIKVDTTDTFSKMLSDHINNIISQDVVRETQIEMLSKIKQFLNVYERFKFIKDIDEITGQCGLCMDRQVDITFLPCHHCCCSHCHSLFQLTNKCPMCRSVISTHHKIFI